MAILKPTTPSTTESATNRIDLDGLSAALTAAGWEARRTPKKIRSIVDELRIRRGPYRLTVISDGCTYLGCTDTGYYNDPRVEVFHVSDYLWHALDLIRAHTTPARSPDDACPTAGEEI